jgi:hypothetical protein
VSEWWLPSGQLAPLVPGSVADSDPMCAETLLAVLDEDGAWSVRCTRSAGHPGRHLAGGGPITRPTVLAAWPGEAPPSAADLTEVPA